MNYYMRYMYIIIFVLLCSSIKTMAMDTLIIVKGYVYDAADNSPLINANIIEIQTQSGTSTDANGFFSFRIPANNIQLRITSVGYRVRTIRLSNFVSDSPIQIPMTKSEIQLNEVTVTASRNNTINSTQMGVVSLSKESIKQVPTLFGEADVIKTLQTQPGVSAGTEGLSGMFVRGGNEDENLFMLDNIPLYKITHFGGLFSAFNVEAIQDVIFYKSSFPSRYGGYLSSVLNISTRKGDMFNHHGSLMLGLTSANVNLEGPIVKGKTSYAVSARRSWLEVLSIPGLAIMNKDSKEKGEKTFGRYAFTDANLKINHNFNSRSSAELILYYGNDYFKIGEQKFMEGDLNFNNEYMTRMSWGNLLIAGKWLYRFNDKMSATITPSYTHYASLLRKNIFESNNIKGDVDYEEFTTKKTTENGIKDLNANIHFDYTLSDQHHINFGMNYIHHRFLPEINKIQTTNIDGTNLHKTDHERVIANEIAFYAEDNWKISQIFRLNAGLRLNLFNVDRTTYRTLEPRISIRTMLSNQMSIKTSYSRMNQFVQQISDSYISLPTDFWVPINSKLEPLRSDQISAGLYYEYAEKYSFSVEGYYKYMHNLLEYKEGHTSMPISVNWDEKLTPGKGWSYGAEWTITKKKGIFTGLFSYGLMWSNRQFEELNQGKRFPSKYDNRHKINIAGNYKINSTLELNGSWTYITGNRMTLTLEDYLNFSVNGFDPSLAPTNPFQNDWVSYYENRNNIRLPAYHRLDIGLNIYRPLKNGNLGIWNISLWNAYNRINPIVIRTDTMYSDNDQKKKNPRFQTVGLFPIIPSISYTYKF